MRPSNELLLLLLMSLMLMLPLLLSSLDFYGLEFMGRHSTPPGLQHSVQHSHST